MLYRNWVGVGASILLGLIFVAAGLGKLLEQAETLEIFYTLPAAFSTPALAGAVSFWLPIIELIVGLLLVTSVAAKPTVAFSLALIAGFIATNSWLLSQGLGDEPCGCFGIVETMAHFRLVVINSLYFDVGMLGLGLLILVYYPGKFFTFRPWFLARRKTASDFRDNADG
jgi:uncharacterized membrane protein YphA (DoxX/SURF4 family)